MASMDLMERSLDLMEGHLTSVMDLMAESSLTTSTVLMADPSVPMPMVQTEEDSLKTSLALMEDHLETMAMALMVKNCQVSSTDQMAGHLMTMAMDPMGESSLLTSMVLMAGHWVTMVMALMEKGSPVIGMALRKHMDLTEGGCPGTSTDQRAQGKVPAAAPMIPTGGSSPVRSTDQTAGDWETTPTTAGRHRA